MEWGQGEERLEGFCDNILAKYAGNDMFYFVHKYALLNDLSILINGRYITPKSFPQCWQSYMLKHRSKRHK